MHPVCARLNYQNFETAITDRYRVICEGWPGVFRAPSELRSRVELETLLNALENGLVKFTKLTPQQLTQRREEKAKEEAALRAANQAAPVANAEAPPDGESPPESRALTPAPLPFVAAVL